MRTIDRYMVESTVNLKSSEIKKLVSNKKSGTHTIDGKKVIITFAGDVLVIKYPSDMYELTYILVDISDDLGYKYTQVGMNSNKEMKFIIDFG